MRKTVLLLIAVLATSLITYANDQRPATRATFVITVDDVSYNIITDSLNEDNPDGYATVRMPGNEDAQDIVIKSKVEREGTSYNVIRIDAGAFIGRENLRTVTIEEGVREIGNKAFSECTSLQSVALPPTIDNIEDNAFSSCSSLTDINLPDKLTVLKNSVFNMCSSLKDVTFPPSLTTIEGYAFSRCAIADLVIPANVTSIGWHAFDCESLANVKCEAVQPPVWSNGSSPLPQHITTVTVPKGSAAAYRNSDWKNLIIINGDPLHVTVDANQAGGLKDNILLQADDLLDVNMLTVSGSLNDDDLSVITGQLTGLLELDMSGTDLKEIPGSFMYGNDIITSITLPATAETIGQSAFAGCSSLQNVTLPPTLTSIIAYAFSNCIRLQNITLPSTLTNIGRCAFENCSSLTSINIPGSVAKIEDTAFSECTKLKSVTFNEGLTEIGLDAFRGCDSLESISIPTSVRIIGGRAFAYNGRLSSVELHEGLEELLGGTFDNCPSLHTLELPSTLRTCHNLFGNPGYLIELTCKAAVPPVSSNSMGGTHPDNITLYVPEISITSYSKAKGWDAIKNIKPIEGYEPESYFIGQEQEAYFTESQRPTNNPDVTISTVFGTSYIDRPLTGGRMTVEGDDMLSIGTFKMVTDLTDMNYFYMSNNHNHYTVLLNNSPMQAETVENQFGFCDNKWHFISLPYNAKVSDIKPGGGVSWVIRKYSGANRAAGLNDSTWLNLTEDSVMHAGEGYIIMCDHESDPHSLMWFYAQDDDKKNAIFATEAVDVPLQKHVAEFAHNSSWNLVGNPYPCFYDTRRLGFNAPFTVWNGRGYTAYTVTDDMYVMRPFEAFFVQCPESSSSIRFNPEGKQISPVPTELQSGLPAKTRADEIRTVINLTITDGSYTDRARIVFNDKARPDYEIERDASKFMSSDSSVPQIYSIGADGRYSINERPAGDGRAIIGAYFGKDGIHTIALSGNIDAEVVLTDLYENKTCTLNRQPYTFDAEKGVCNDRFIINVNNGTTRITDIQEHGGDADISVNNGVMTIEQADKGDIEVYSIGGSLIYKTFSDKASVSVGNGIYIVKTGAKSQKIIVTNN